MKVKLLKDVSIPQGGVGTIGQVVEMSQHLAQEYIRLGHAQEVPDSKAEAEPKKESKPADARATKPAKGPTETK